VAWYVRDTTGGGPEWHRRATVRQFGTLIVDGRSMLPTLRAGDRLLVRYGAPARVGALGVVVLPDRPLAVKRFGVRSAEGWWVERDNPAEGVDSWTLGHAVPDADIRAIVVARLWPRPSLLRRRSGPAVTAT